jgi:XRE family transcriptional regulator, regulator of sulfur utilization
MNIGKAIKEVRKQYTDLNQKEFSDKIGITQAYLSQIENNKKKPSTDLLLKISDITKIPMQILLWKSLTIDDIPKHKKDIYNQLKPVIDSMINQII